MELSPSPAMVPAPPPVRPRSHGRRLLVATAMVAIGVPVGAAWWVDARTADLVAHLTAAGGVPVQLGGVDADLTGAVRLSGIAFGDLASAEAIEASVALDSLIAMRATSGSGEGAPATCGPGRVASEHASGIKGRVVRAVLAGPGTVELSGSERHRVEIRDDIHTGLVDAYRIEDLPGGERGQAVCDRLPIRPDPAAG